MKYDRFRSMVWLLQLFLSGPLFAEEPRVNAVSAHEHPLGLSVRYLQETHGPLSLSEAIDAYEADRFVPGWSDALNFGINAKPVWVHLKVINWTPKPLRRRLSIETPWLDTVDVYLLQRGAIVNRHFMGDHQAFSGRPLDSRHFAFDHDFSTGDTEIFIRIATPDPMVVPIYLLTPRQAVDRERLHHYTYGFLYGYLAALLAYNLMLYAGLRQPRYIWYSVYLLMFLVMNLAYTGHAFQWLWPRATLWAQWANPILIVLYGISGLVFAQSFLNTRERFPRTHKAVRTYIVLATTLLSLAVISDQRILALLVAFTFVFLFTIIMLALGILAVRAGQRPARYFLTAAFTAMVGAASTALSTWGFIPFNTWTFRAVEMGILIDATLLALALTYQIRMGQELRLRAEHLAAMDPLTGLNNRRSFYGKVLPIWSGAIRHEHALSVVLVDIDRFKNINDTYGHAFGDEVLVVASRVLTDAIRGQDVVARWGGEEFILVLPETDVDAATSLAERLRAGIQDLRLRKVGHEVELTASFGVAQRQPQHKTLESLIATADKNLYLSKAEGRNRVTAA